MKKLLIPIAVALSVGFLPSLFADTGSGTTNTGSGSTESGSTNTGSSNTGSTSSGSTNTGATSTGSTNTGSTNTGSTSTGSTNTGSTNTGSTNTGSTNTGSTWTGSTNTGILNCGSGNYMSNLAARETYLKELTRLLAEKRSGYEAAMTLSGTAKRDAIRVANEKFRAGQKVALKNFALSRKAILVCKRLEDRQHTMNYDRDEDNGKNQGIKRNSDDDNDKNRGQMRKMEKADEKLIKKVGKMMEKDMKKSFKGRR